MGLPIFLARLRGNSDANVLAMAAVLMPVMIGAAGLGVDTIQWTLAQRQMQRMADTAALAGALAKSQGFSASSSASAALTAAKLTTMNRIPVIETPPTSGSYSGNTGAVRVILTTSKPLPFSSLFLRAGPLIRVEATAASVSNGTYCVLSLESTSTAGVTLQGSSSVDMGCGIATNSTAAQAITTGGSSSVAASPVAAVGGLRSSVNYAPGTVLLPHSLAQQDPFKSLPSLSPYTTSSYPTSGLPTVCKLATSLKVQPNTTVNVTNPSGVACYKDMSLKGNVTFAPGLYYFSGGSLDIAASANVSGTGVTFILPYVSPSSSANVNVSGSATVNLSAPTSGTYAGVLIYQDRLAPSNGSNTISGNGSSKLQGAIYMPAQQVTLAGTIGMNTKCLQIVARRVAFSGASTIENDCPTNSGAHAFTGTRVFLVG